MQACVCIYSSMSENKKRKKKTRLGIDKNETGNRNGGEEKGRGTINSYVRPFLLHWTLKHIPQHVYLRPGLECNAREQALIVNIPYQLRRRGGKV